MKKQTKIYILNLATVIFALLTVISIGGIGSVPAYTVMVNTALFGLLTYTCHTKEMALRRQLRSRRKKVKLSVYSGNNEAKYAA